MLYVKASVSDQVCKGGKEKSFFYHLKKQRQCIDGHCNFNSLFRSWVSEKMG